MRRGATAISTNPVLIVPSGELNLTPVEPIAFSKKRSMTIEERFSMIDDLNVFMGALKLEKYVSVLAEQEIDVDTLKTMSKEELIAAKLPIGAALKILKAGREESLHRGWCSEMP